MATSSSFRFAAFASPITVPIVTAPPLVKIVLRTPAAPSFPTEEAMKAMKVCQPRPKILVTGSMAFPALYRMEPSILPVNENESSQKMNATRSTTLRTRKKVSLVRPRT